MLENYMYKDEALCDPTT